MKNKHIFRLIIIMAPLGQVSIDLYSSSLPIIAHDLHTNSNLVGLTILFFLIAFGIGQFCYGSLSDAYGRKIILSATLPFYIISSAIIPLCSSIYTIILLRFIQGLAIASPSVITKSIAADVYKEQELAKMISYLAITWGLSPILAPLLGAYIQTILGWRWEFYLLSIASVFIYMYMLYSLPETNKYRCKFKFKDSYNSHMEILSNYGFWVSMLQLGLSYSSLLVFITQTPFLFQKHFNLTYVANGYIVLLVSVFYIIGSKLGQRIPSIKIHFYKFFNYTAGAVILSSLFMLLGISNNFLNLNASLSIIISIMFFMGIVFPISLANCLQLFRDKAGAMSGTVGLLSLGVASCAIAIPSVLQVNTQLSFPLILLILSSIIFIILKILNVKHNHSVVCR